MKTGISATAVVIALCCVAARPVASAQEDLKARPTKQERSDLARKLIRETPRPGQGMNPLAVIRSVNCLHSLGKKRAISLLLEVASPDERLIVVDPESDNETVQSRLWRRDGQRVCMIVPLLFDVPEKGTPPPDGRYCKQNRCWTGAAGTQVVQDGIPFVIGGSWTYGGSPIPTRPLVEWADKHGVLRAKPLCPQGNPLQVADALRDRLSSGVVTQFEKLVEGFDESDREKVIENKKNDLQVQAIWMLPKTIRVAMNLRYDRIHDMEDTEWDELRQKTGELNLLWDHKKQEYILMDEPNDH